MNETIEKPSLSLKDKLIARANELETAADQTATYGDLLTVGMASLIVPVAASGLALHLGGQPLSFPLQQIFATSTTAEFYTMFKSITSSDNKLDSPLKSKDGKEIKFSTHVLPAIAKAYRQVAKIV